MTQSRSSESNIKLVTRNITIKGIRPIMFDRYPGDNDTKLEWHEKIYLRPGTNRLVLPIANVFSFFTAHNTSSAPKRLRDKRKYKDICNAIQSYVQFEGTNGTEDDFIDFKREGSPIEVGEFDESFDSSSQIRLHTAVARLDKGIPNNKRRPLLPLPWSLTFTMTMLPNEAIKEAELRNLLIQGGMAIGLGTFRGQYGKFELETWE